MAIYNNTDPEDDLDYEDNNSQAYDSDDGGEPVLPSAIDDEDAIQILRSEYLQDHATQSRPRKFVDLANGYGWKAIGLELNQIHQHDRLGRSFPIWTNMNYAAKNRYRNFVANMINAHDFRLRGLRRGLDSLDVERCIYVAYWTLPSSEVDLRAWRWEEGFTHDLKQIERPVSFLTLGKDGVAGWNSSEPKPELYQIPRLVQGTTDQRRGFLAGQMAEHLRTVFSAFAESSLYKDASHGQKSEMATELRRIYGQRLVELLVRDDQLTVDFCEEETMYWAEDVFPDDLNVVAGSYWRAERTAWSPSPIGNQHEFSGTDFLVQRADDPEEEAQSAASTDKANTGGKRKLEQMSAPSTKQDRATQRVKTAHMPDFAQLAFRPAR